MTVWARNDVCATAISLEHGGCGKLHTRPVVQGAPVKHWALNCPGGCEDFLRSDPLWAGTPQAVPETPDEVVIREDVEKRGAHDQAASTAAALTELAKLGNLPEILMALLANMQQNQALAAPQAALAVPQGALEGVVEPQDAEPAEEPEDAAPEPQDGTPLEELTFGQLKELAVQRGLRVTRSKEDQIAVLREAAES